MWNAPIKTLKGQPTTLAAYKGKALMLVNVASQCGNTPQYATLEALQKKYERKGFTVIGFPCNQFGGQEPGSAEEIADVLLDELRHHVPDHGEDRGQRRQPPRHLQGADADRRRRRATPATSGGTSRSSWSRADGTKITRFAHKTKPDDPAVIAAVETALPK